MGRWVGGPEVTLEGRDERLVLGLPSSSWREEEEEDEDVAGPRLLRCEMRAFLGANGSMKSKSGWRFCRNTSRTELKISPFTMGMSVFLSVFVVIPGAMWGHCLWERCLSVSLWEDLICC